MPTIPAGKTNHPANFFNSYGPHAWNITKHFIIAMSNQLAASTNVSLDCFEDFEGIVKDILVPDVVFFLVSQDYDCSIDQGLRMAWISELYGAREFPLPPHCRVVDELQKGESRLFRRVLRHIESHESSRS